MVEIELDGKKIEVSEGSMVMHAAERAGVYIPHFCYHKKLSIAANCRMCLVEIEKAPKAMPACATPVAQGMVVRTNSDKVVRAQKSVMEFLLINHPLDCPICDQGGECQLQDLAVGYGSTASRYDAQKRVVRAKSVGPLISMEEMNRCIQCTRCVRFGQEIAGVMELGMVNRGEHSEIKTFVGQAVTSELSGNMIDVCPVGALTSKPFRYQARTWELARRKSIAPHDSTGSNIIVQVFDNSVVRVLPLENEAVNECWIADRDRFAYEGLNSPERLTNPMLKQDGKWSQVDWKTALEYVANGLKQIQSESGVQSIGALVSPHSTVEEGYLLTQLIRALGSDNIDHRLRHAQFTNTSHVPWLGMPIAALSSLDNVLVIGSELRYEHPLFAQRIRQAVRRGASVHRINAHDSDWAMPIHNECIAPASQWLQILRDSRLKEWLATGKSKAVLLGNACAHHGQAQEILALAQQLAQQTGARLGYLVEAANTVGMGLVKAWPQAGGKNAAAMLGGGVQAAVLLNVEAQDTVSGLNGLRETQMVVSLSPYQTNQDVADVLLPVAPFSETAGSFVNAEGRLQSFYGVVKPLGQTRPAWKVLRVLATMLELSGFAFDDCKAILRKALGSDQSNTLYHEHLSNDSVLQANAVASASWNGATPAVAAMYQLDSIVRRAPALQAMQRLQDASSAVAQEEQA